MKKTEVKVGRVAKAKRFFVTPREKAEEKKGAEK